MSELQDAFEERLQEVRAYMSLLALMEAQAQSGPPRFAGTDTVITPQQQKLLYAGVYLQLYNLVEATMTLCVESIAEAASRDDQWKPHDLSDPLRREWVRSTARTHVDLSYPKRLDAAVEAVDHLLAARPVGSAFTIERGGGGNWDDKAIEDISSRLGCTLKVSQPVQTSVKRRLKDDMGALALVKSRRNSLAHGSMSFTQSAEATTVSDLEMIVDAVVAYLTEVVDHFDAYVKNHGFLSPEHRPVGSQ
ncbi:MAG TPA: MAE_28990/MAE_18760 family HEPN-like nuclease [Thermoleophilaceae bacterium]|jgi:hypothetical protein